MRLMEGNTYVTQKEQLKPGLPSALLHGSAELSLCSQALPKKKGSKTLALKKEKHKKINERKCLMTFAFSSPLSPLFAPSTEKKNSEKHLCQLPNQILTSPGIKLSSPEFCLEITTGGSWILKLLQDTRDVDTVLRVSRHGRLLHPPPFPTVTWSSLNEWIPNLI